MRIGVDVGGTNTDAVLLADREVIASVKRPTTADVSSGVRQAITDVLEQGRADVAAVSAVMIGTTHFTNAFVQARDLARVAVFRIGYPATRDIPPFASWPSRLRETCDGGALFVPGGFQFDGTEIASLDLGKVLEGVQAFRGRGVTNFAVAGVFSQLNDAHERQVAETIAANCPEASVSVSSEIGRVGLIERENAAIMNASLVPLAREVANAFEEALRELGILAPFFVSQNDGTLMSAEHMRRYPVLTFAAGPTNSLRGAAFLTGSTDALVADIGGTTTDFGALTNGFPRQSSVHVDIGGVRTNFRMPDILSIGLGGGSRVRIEGDTVRVGPDSVGFDLAREAMVFGGTTLTASDIAVAAGHASLGDRAQVSSLEQGTVSAALGEMRRMVEDGVDRVRTSPAPLPLILVGGGSVLLEEAPAGVSAVLKPEHAHVANAIGAAIGQVSGEVDLIFNLDEVGRQAALDNAADQARQSAVAAGAALDQLEIVELDVLPLQYLPSGAARVVCRVVGPLASSAGLAHA